MGRYSPRRRERTRENGAFCYIADKLLKGAVFNITEDERIQIDIGDYDIGGDEMAFYCTHFSTEGVSFPLPAV